MNRPSNFFSTLLPLSLLLLLFSACSEMDRSSIHDLLDARDQAVSSRSMADFSVLLLSAYEDQNTEKADVLAQMISMFNRFDKIQMLSRDRDIRILSDTDAQCEQTYTLKVFADGDWREVVIREQLSLSKVASGWKISGGL